jgi:predicted branched-subunit amino acid permease
MSTGLGLDQPSPNVPSPLAGASEGRRQLLWDTAAVAPSAAAFGLVYGLAAREAGLSLVETVAMSVVVLAGSAQFATVGLLAQGAGWLAVLAATVALNLRHLLYGIAMAPWLVNRSMAVRAATAYVLTDEVFALALAHFRRRRRADLRGYWLTAVVPAAWILTSAAGYALGELIPDPERWGLDVIFPIAMGGLAMGFLSDATARLAAAIAAISAVAVGLAWSLPLAVVVAGALSPIVARRLAVTVGLH